MKWIEALALVMAVPFAHSVYDHEVLGKPRTYAPSPPTSRGVTRRGTVFFPVQSTMFPSGETISLRVGVLTSRPQPKFLIIDDQTLTIQGTGNDIDILTGVVGELSRGNPDKTFRIVPNDGSVVGLAIFA